jgi:hypothetical protein
VSEQKREINRKKRIGSNEGEFIQSTEACYEAETQFQSEAKQSVEESLLRSRNSVGKETDTI